MKINKDLVDAVMMVSFIILVLIGTTDFENAITKDVTMGALGLVTVAMVILRGIQMQPKSLRKNTNIKSLIRIFLTTLTEMSSCFLLLFRSDPGLSEVRFSA